MDIIEWVQVILEDDLYKGISNTKGASTQSDLLPLTASLEGIGDSGMYR
jgi:hypothetical protein